MKVEPGTRDTTSSNRKVGQSPDGMTVALWVGSPTFQSNVLALGKHSSQNATGRATVPGQDIAISRHTFVWETRSWIL